MGRSLALMFVLLAAGLLGLPVVAQAKAKPHHASYTQAPTEEALFAALKKAVYGSQKDRSAADALFKRVLRDDDVGPVNYVLYPVYGSSPEEIRASQAQSKLQAGISEWGLTHSQWSFHYDLNGPVHLKLKTSVTMPKWRSSQGGSQALSSWRSFYSALLYHEQGHVLIGEYVVALMRLRLNAASASASADVNAICSQLGDALDSLNQQYDQRTNHGTSQGAVL